MTTVQDPPVANDVDDDIEVIGAEKKTRAGIVRRVAMRGRKVFVRAHRWIAFVLLAWLVIVSLTGAWLVFNQALDGKLHSERYHKTAGDVGPSKAFLAAEASLPDDERGAYYLTFPVNARGVYRVLFSQPLKGGAEGAEKYGIVFVDPGSGKVNARTYDNVGFTPWVYRGHMYLWQDHGLFGVFEPQHGWCRATEGVEPGGVKGVVCDVIPGGEDMVAWFGLGWIVVLLTGFYLWYWPGVRRWATAFVIKRGPGRFATNMSIHKVVGLVVFVPLLVVAFTGVAFAFPNMKGWYQNATPAGRGVDLWVPPESAVSHPIKGQEPLDADAVLAAIEDRFPERRIDGIEPPTDEKGLWYAWVDRGFSPWTREGGAGNTYVGVDQYSGKVVYDESPEQGNVFEQAWDDWTFPLHTGDFVGTTTRSLWVVLATSPIVLGVTGTTMWLVRRKKRKKRAAAPA